MDESSTISNENTYLLSLGEITRATVTIAFSLAGSMSSYVYVYVYLLFEGIVPLYVYLITNNTNGSNKNKMFCIKPSNLPGNSELLESNNIQDVLETLQVRNLVAAQGGDFPL